MKRSLFAAPLLLFLLLALTPAAHAAGSGGFSLTLWADNPEILFCGETETLGASPSP